jgi:hypothetical protein
MRSASAVLFVAASALAPLIWAACTDPPPAVSPPAAASDTAGPATAAPSTEEGPGTTAALSSPPPESAAPDPAPPPSASGPRTAGLVTASPEVERLVAGLPKKGTVRSAAECQALIPRTNAAMDTAHAKAVACTADADCEVIRNGICLAPSCGIGIAKAARAAYEADRTRITEAACGAWYGGGCETKVPIPTPSCAMLEPVCKGGRCATRY